MHRGENNEQTFMRMGIIAASINKKIVNHPSFRNELWDSMSDKQNIVRITGYRCSVIRHIRVNWTSIVCFIACWTTGGQTHPLFSNIYYHNLDNLLRLQSIYKRVMPTSCSKGYETDYRSKLFMSNLIA